MWHAPLDDGGQEGELGLLVDKQQILDRSAFQKCFQQAGLGMPADAPGGTRIAQVGVDQQCSRTLHREQLRKVHRDRRLTFARQAGHDADDLGHALAAFDIYGDLGTAHRFGES